MNKMKVFIDTNIFIYWLKQTLGYSNIEKIRKLAKEEKVEIIISLDVLLELHKGDAGSRDIGKIEQKWGYVIDYLTPNFVVGNTREAKESRETLLAEYVSKWKELLKSVDDEDTKHYITSALAGAKYFLTLNDRFINKMKNEGRKHLTAPKIVKPKEFIEAFNIVEKK